MSKKVSKTTLKRKKTISNLSNIVLQSDSTTSLYSFETRDKKTYSGPDITPFHIHDHPKTDNRKFPVYYDIEGNYYDIHYRRVSQELVTRNELEKTKLETEKNLETELSNAQEDDIEFIRNKNSALISNFPDDLQDIPSFPKSQGFSSFDDFEQALIAWKNKITSRFGFVQHPIYIGRSYPRPYLAAEQSEKKQDQEERSSVTDSERMSTDSKRTSEQIPRTSSTSKDSPRTSSIGKSKIIETAHIERRHSTIDEHLDHFSQKKMDKLPDFMEGTSLFISDKEQWSNKLIPPEPKPDNYSSFEEFEKAFQRWSQIVMGTLPKIPIHSRQLSEIYGILTEKEIEEKETKRRKEENALIFIERVKKTKKQIPEIDRYYYWMKRLNYSFFTSLVSSGILSYDYLQYLVYKKTKEEILSEIEIEKQNQEKMEIMNREKQKKLKNLEKQEKEMVMKLSMTQEDRSNIEQTTFGKDTPKVNLSEEAIKGVQNFFSILNEKKEKNFSFYRSFCKPIIGKIHGTLPKSDLAFQQQKLATEQKGGLLQTSRASLYLRRTDLTGPMINSSMDCPSEVDGKNVLFAVPPYEISDAFDFEKIYNEQSRKATISQISKVDNQKRLDQIQFWYNPAKYSLEKFNEQKIKINQLINQSSDKFTIDTLRQILCIEMCLDQFTNLLSDYVIFKNKQVPYSQVFLSCITADNFSEILKIFRETTSFQIHAQLAQFVSETLQAGISKQIIEKYVREHDVNNLYYMAYAFNFLEDSPIPIFPQDSEVLYLSKKHFSGATLSLEKSIFTHYYLSLIWKGLNRGNQNFLFVNVNSQIQQYLKNLKNSFGMTIQSNLQFLRTDLFKAIESSSIKISGYYLLLLMFLIKAEDKVLDEILQSKETALIDKIKYLTNSKYTHVRFSCLQIWNQLLTFPGWTNFLVNYYTENIEVLLKEFTPPLLNDFKENEEEDKKARFMLVLIDNLFEVVFEEIISKSNKESILINPDLYFELIKKLETYIRENYTNSTLIYIGKFLRNLVSSFSSLKLIDPISKEDKTKIVTSQFKKKLRISEEDCLRILSIVGKAPHSLDQMKTYLIEIVCDLIRPEGIFEIIRSSTGFFPQFISLFRDCKNFELSDQFWRLYYETILYHPNVVVHFKKINHLKPMIELISTSSDASITVVGLQYLYKILTMDQKEDRRIQRGESSSRPFEKDSVKKIAKDVKAFADFFDKNALFVKIHMIYMNFQDKAGIKYGGKKFINLAKVYEAIMTNPSCSKIAQTGLKKSDYKEGMELIHSFFGIDEKQKKSKKSGKRGHRK
ncbi:sca1 complex scaffold protein scaa [Anaeramoeba ignava]|uniref:Sca1 complex scaffold protein scaa n=1 Tax=Anaeramoeba ignava TaxID=1746090 RepID=A0A9Q0LXX2_ANAIG|nr:sca1 complex scaffold protein scaa [Anaeramoeba ignava]|eukprot:Anaeramoba_ignava/a89817_105.p1 GENE.a89817_105~~a89817_105.p1  ORF type:complete len:1301 (+),score=410.80 a89817_105:23-3904(+)